MEIDTALSLEALEKEYWQRLEVYPSKLVENCYQFRKIPLKDLSIEQLRTLISQQIGLNFLIPLACNELEKDILAEGDFYAGDLLKAVLSIEQNYWLTHLDLQEKVKTRVQDKMHEIEDVSLLRLVTYFLNEQ